MMTDLHLPEETLQKEKYILFNNKPDWAEFKAVQEKEMLHFGQIFNPRNGESFPANFSYFYPLSPHDYLERMIKMDGTSPPLLVFLYLTTACRDRCTGCFAWKLKGNHKPFSWELIREILTQLAEFGVRAIKFAGRESTLSPFLSEALQLSAGLGLRSVLITGGDNLAKHREAIIHFNTHFRVSINASSAAVHRNLQNPSSSADSYPIRVKNYEEIVTRRRKRNLVSGATFLIAKGSVPDLFNTVKKAREIGFDYIRFIPDIKDPLYHKKNEALQVYLREQVEKSVELSSPDFVVWNPLVIPGIPSRFGETLEPVYRLPSLHLRTTIFADGKVIACPDFLLEGIKEDSLGVYGNLWGQSFRDIWLGERRKAFIDGITSNLEAGSGCPPCKYHQLNQILRFMALQVKHKA